MSLLATLGRLAATLLATAQTRLALLQDDLEEARERLFVLVLWWIGGLFALGLGVVLAFAWLMLVVDPAQRVVVLGGGAVVLLLVGVAALAVASDRHRRAPRWLAGTLDELEKDGLALRRPSP